MSEEIRVGVFICDCGSNIAGVVNVPELVSYSKALDGVVFSDEGKWSCSVDYLSKMSDLIKEHAINRVVVASCTPRTHEPLFKRTVKAAGVNPYLLEFVSIREQVSWVHMKAPLAATKKAKDLVKMGVAKAALLEEGEEIRLRVGQTALVIGGGIAGMTAAQSIADQGFTAHLVEKEPVLGGLMNRINTISHNHETRPALDLIPKKIDVIESHPQITVHKESELTAVKGYVGNYTVTLKKRKDPNNTKLEVSTITVATGMKEILPQSLFGYGSNPDVITQLQLEEMMIKEKKSDEYNRVVMINCVGSKNDKRGCCNIGCHIALKNAIQLKKSDPSRKIHILYRDLSLVKDEGHLLKEAKQLGVHLIRFPDDLYPKVQTTPGGKRVEVLDFLLGETFKIPADLIVLTTAFEGDNSINHIKGLLKVSTGKGGFFQESHVKLAPLEFPVDGISLCGASKSPLPFKESMEEGLGAAMRVSIPMRNGFVETEGIVAEISSEGCNGCGLCVKRCPYNAIMETENETPEVIKALCKGCGLCAADCPKLCIRIVHYSDEQILAQIDAALSENPTEKIIGFVCHWCALGGVDMAGVSRLQYPTPIRLIRVMCSARVSIEMMRYAFDHNAAGVLVAGCEFPTCHYITGNYAAETRIKRARRILKKKGYDPEKLWNVWCSAADGPKFANTMHQMTEALGLLKEEA